MIDFFSLLQLESGLANLTSAARSGHLESVYVYGIVALCRGQQEEGMAWLRSIDGGGGSRSPEIVRYCRNRVKLVRGVMWIKNFMVGENNPAGRRNNCDSCGGGGVEVAAPAVGSEERWVTREDVQLEFYAANSCRSCFGTIGRENEEEA
ncbi:hypothetical protein LINGRAHAP2_LOCUS1712 [Linum grandiflorum]